MYYSSYFVKQNLFSPGCSLVTQTKMGYRWNSATHWYSWLPVTDSLRRAVLAQGKLTADLWLKAVSFFETSLWSAVLFSLLLLYLKDFLDIGEVDRHVAWVYVSDQWWYQHIVFRIYQLCRGTTVHESAVKSFTGFLNKKGYEVSPVTCCKILAPRDRFELPTWWLTATRSTDWANGE